MGNKDGRSPLRSGPASIATGTSLTAIASGAGKSHKISHEGVAKVLRAAET